MAAMDLNGVNTLYSYNDALERLTQVRRASGGGLRLESQTNYVYPNPNWAVAYQDENSTGDGAMQTQSVYDGLGRLTESRVMENARSSTSVASRPMMRWEG